MTSVTIANSPVTLIYIDEPTGQTELEAATKTALILGSTGQTGRHLLRELIASPTYTRVCEAGRRVTPAEDLAALPSQGREKLEQKVVDFERLDEAGLKEGQWDVVFIAYVSVFFFFRLVCPEFESGRRLGRWRSSFVLSSVVVGWARP